MDEWTKAPFCVMINRNNCDNYSVDRICEVTEQLQITTERGIFDGIYIRNKPEKQITMGILDTCGCGKVPRLSEGILYTL